MIDLNMMINSQKYRSSWLEYSESKINSLAQILEIEKDFKSSNIVTMNY